MASGKIKLSNAAANKVPDETNIDKYGTLLPLVLLKTLGPKPCLASPNKIRLLE